MTIYYYIFYNLLYFSLEKTKREKCREKVARRVWDGRRNEERLFIEIMLCIIKHEKKERVMRERVIKLILKEGDKKKVNEEVDFLFLKDISIF